MPSIAVAGIAASMIASQQQANAAEDAAEAQQDIANKQLDMSEEQYDRYLEIYDPLERQMVQEAQDEPNYEQLMGQYGAETAKQFDTSWEIMQRNANRLGADPTSGSYQEMGKDYAIQRALGMADARNKARMDASRDAWNKKQNAVSLGRGIPATALQGMSSAANTMGANSALQYGQAANTAQGAANLVGQVGNSFGLNSNQSLLNFGGVASGGGGGSNYGPAGGGFQAGTGGGDMSSAGFVPYDF